MPDDQRIEGERVEVVEARRRFALRPFAEITLDRTVPYLIKGLIPREGLVLKWGPPKCGKSFETLDQAMHIALGWPYRGRKVQPGTVVYIAAEGERGLSKRIEAFRQHHLAEQHEPPPFYLLTTRLDLVADYDALATDVEAQTPEDPAIIVVDTVNRTLMGSESSDEDMGAYVDAAEQLRRQFGCAVVLIHHCGWDDKRPRGHSSLSAAIDQQISVKKDMSGLITATVEYSKDDTEGETILSRLEVMDVDIDEDGDPITSCVVVPADPSEAPATTATHRLSQNAEVMFSLLREAGPAGLTVEEWTEEAKAVGDYEKTPRQHFYKWRCQLRDKGLARSYGDRWYANL